MVKTKFVKGGDIFKSGLQTIVIPVNTVGVMGAGLAKQAKIKYPNMFIDYQGLCYNTKIKVHTPHVWRSDDENEHDILLFATKKKWSNPSKMEYIKDGLYWLEHNARREGITSIAFPQIGCGLGGLDWDEVKVLLMKTLDKLSALDIETEVYE